VSSYTYYFVEFYMKLVPFDNIYGLMILIGFSDVTGTYAFYVLSNKFAEKQVSMAQSTFAAMFTLSLTMFISLEANKEHTQSDWYAILVFAIRFSSNITFNLSVNLGYL
jgi:hypothetical protein